MKKVIPIIIAIVVIVGVGIFLTNKKSSDKTSSTSSSSSPSDMSNMPSPQPNPSQTPESTNKVSISNFNFSPATITVKKGTTVTWTNQDSIAHDVQETDGKTGPKSGSLSQGQTYTFTYDTAGTFNYHCSFHPEMIGKVVVTE